MHKKLTPEQCKTLKVEQASGAQPVDTLTRLEGAQFELHASEGLEQREVSDLIEQPLAWIG